MLLNATRRHGELPSEVDSIHNYYEHLVLEEIVHTLDRAHTDLNFMADVACVALNRLPPRYIRHNVDMTFFMSPQELMEIEAKVSAAVAAAAAYVVSREPAPEPEPAAVDAGADTAADADVAVTATEATAAPAGN
jgi:hypothetical protein